MLILGASGANTVFAPATTSLTLGAGSLTSVSADGLSIPYGVTTDQFVRCLEESTGRELRPFFSQWLDRVGCPELRVQPEAGAIVIEQRSGVPIFCLQIIGILVSDRTNDS